VSTTFKLSNQSPAKIQYTVQF